MTHMTLINLFIRTIIVTINNILYAIVQILFKSILGNQPQFKSYL